MKLLAVEAALVRAHAEMGEVPSDAADEVTSKATLEHVSMERVKEIEEETKHDIMAVVKALAEQCDQGGKYVHLGATSNDIIDTATALQLKESIAIIEQDLESLALTFAQIAKAHKNTITVGRTHGQYAVPTTFGFRIAGYLSEVLRYIERLGEAKKRVLVGKMSGAVGTGAAMGTNALKIQREVMKDLGLGVEEVSTQLVGRDRYSELITLLAELCTSCERYATEIRNLQRSEVQEVTESFDTDSQVGSSTMAHKKNPILSENICGLARIARSFITPTLENMVLWHERDLTNSSSERFTIPHVVVLTDDILAKTDLVFSNLLIDKERMRKNLDSSMGMVMAEAVMIALVDKGMGRQEAHELVRKCSMQAGEKNRHLKEELAASDEINELLAEEELEGVMDPENYLGASKELIDKTIYRAEIVTGRKI